MLLNDFEALALALTALGRRIWSSIGAEIGRRRARRSCSGPGTGLGVGALIRGGGLWVPVPGEGGHVALGPAEPDEFPLWPNIEPEFGRISAEALLSGRGLVRLYRARGAHRRRRRRSTTSRRRSPRPRSPAPTRRRCAPSRSTAGCSAAWRATWRSSSWRAAASISAAASRRASCPSCARASSAAPSRRKRRTKTVMAEMPTWVISRDSPALRRPRRLRAHAGALRHDARRPALAEKA